jgi:hypothetical protein
VPEWYWETRKNLPGLVGNQDVGVAGEVRDIWPVLSAVDTVCICVLRRIGRGDHGRDLVTVLHIQGYRVDVHGGALDDVGEVLLVEREGEVPAAVRETAHSVESRSAGRTVG